jgi:hypothetical protein
MCETVLIYANTKYDLPSAGFHEYHKSSTAICALSLTNEFHPEVNNK